MKILVQGTGGIGGVIAAHLIRGGADVTPVTGNAEVADALNRDGFRLDEPDGRAVVPVVRPAVQTPPAEGGPYDLILVATQTPRLQDALRQRRHLLAPDGHVLCVQNGLPEPYAWEVVPRERVLGGVVSWAASMVAPGQYKRHSPGSVALGRPGQPVDAVVERVAAALQPVGRVSATDNLDGVRWSKIALNSTITTMGAVAGLTLGEVMVKSYARDLALQIISEVCDVSGALGVRLEKVSGTFHLPDMAWPAAARRSPPALGRLWRHAVLLAVGAKYRTARSSMLYALERGRVPEVDYLNGEIVRYGAQNGLVTPVNSALVDLVHRIARGEIKSDLGHLSALRDQVMA